MPIVCVVPGCIMGANKNNRRVKCSMFCIPNDEQLRSQWLKAIPGITSLRPTDFICEKHFSKECFITKFIKKDIHGNIITTPVYQRPHLKKNSMPTIFKKFDMLSLLPAEVKTEDSPQIKMIKAENVNDIGNNNKRNVNNLNDTSKESSKIKILQNITLNNQKDKIVILKKVPKATMQKIMLQRPFLNIQTIGKNMFKQSVKDININNIPVSKDDSKEKNPIMTKDVNNGGNSAKKSESLSKTYAMEHDYALHDLPRPIFCTNTVNIDPKSLELPKRWGVTEKMVENKKYLLFTKVVTQVIDQRESEALQKYMLLNCTEKNASYFVYGHEIKDMITLPEIIHSTDILLRCLNIFEAMRVCEGVGPIDSCLLPKSEVLRDSVNFLRHINCTWLLTRTNVCINCKKLKQLVSTRSSNNIVHDGTVSKEMFINLKRKLAREKRRRNTVIEQKKMLLKELFKQRKQTADAIDYSVSLESICLQHRVLNNHRLVLKEILETSKTKPQGRRYSEEWLMFCISVSIRSPSTYEFLRKTNIIPLPGLHTIRRYFYGKKPRGNLDKTFVDLVRNYQFNNAEQVSETSIYQNTNGNAFQLDER